MTSGINRRARQASPNQAIEGENIFASEGDLVRRPAFSAIASGPPFALPSQATEMMYYDGDTWFTLARGGSISRASIGDNTLVLAIGAEEKFDGIDIPLMVEQTGVLSAHRYAVIRTIDDTGPSAFTQIPWIKDTTRRWDSGYASSMMGPGRIFWHSSDLSSWSKVTLNSLNKYWICINLTAEPVNPDGGDRVLAAGQGTIQFRQPGVRAYHLEPVTFIEQIRGRRGNGLVVASEREGNRGQEKGLQISVWDNLNRNAEIAEIVREEGSGLLGQFTNPTWSGANGTGGTAIGGADELKKLDDSYDWNPLLSGTVDFDGQWSRQTIQETVAVDTAGDAENFVSNDPVYERDNQFEHCVLECTVSGSGPAVGERRVVVRSIEESGGTRFYVSPDWSTAPTTSTTFKLLGTQYRAKCSEFDVDTNTSRENKVAFAIQSNDEDVLTLETDDSYMRTADVSIDDSFVNFYIGKELRWEAEKNGGVGYTFDPIRRRHLFCNGSSPMIEYDGLRWREVLATFSPTSALVEYWTGILSDQARELNTVQLTPGSFLRKAPPTGKFLSDFLGRIVVSGDPGDPTRVYWSAPGEANSLWPKLYETIIRDSRNQAIAGMRTNGRELVVWTPNAIFSAGTPDVSGIFYFAPASQNTGFACNDAVEQIPFNGSTALIGPNADGVYVYAAGSVIPVLSEWESVLRDGVNRSKLSGAVAAANLSETLYFLAVPSSKSGLNDKVLVYDWSIQTWYEWDAPFGGVSSMAVSRDETGDEVVLFGHYDGTVSVLTNNETDDGDTITGRARSIPQSFDNITTAPIAIMLNMFTDQSNVTIRTFIDQTGKPKQEASIEFNGDEAVYNTATYSSDESGGVFSGQRWKTKRVNLPSGTRGTQLQYEIEGASRWRLRDATLLAKPKSFRRGA